MNSVKKNKTADVGKYTYKYVDIAQIHAYLESIGVSYYQFIDRLDGDDYIMTVKIIDGKESEPIRGARVVDATLVGTNNPAQQQGSAITYARRYSLLMAFGLATEDDDAQALSTPKEERKASAKQIAYIQKLADFETLDELMKEYGSTLENMPIDVASELIGKLKSNG